VLYQSSDPFSFDFPITPIISVVILVVLMILMVLFYSKKKIFLIILTIHLFSLVIGLDSIGTESIPFTPWFQTFFIVFQTIFLLLTSIEVFRS